MPRSKPRRGNHHKPGRIIRRFSFDDVPEQKAEPVPPRPTSIDPWNVDPRLWDAYNEHFDLVFLPPKRPEDPKEGEYEPFPDSFEVPIEGYPGWRLGFLPKGTIEAHYAVIPYRVVETTLKQRRQVHGQG